MLDSDMVFSIIKLSKKKKKKKKKVIVWYYNKKIQSKEVIRCNLILIISIRDPGWKLTIYS